MVQHIFLKPLNNYGANTRGHIRNLENINKTLLNGNTKQIKDNLNEQLSLSSLKQIKRTVSNSNRKPMPLKKQNSNGRIRNFMPALSKIANKYKTCEGNKKRVKNTSNSVMQQKCFKFMAQVPYEYRIANKLRLAVKEGQSRKPWENINLRQLVVKALNKGIAWKSIESILNECKIRQKMKENCHLLEICYRAKVFLIVNVSTTNLVKFKKLLTKTILHKHKGQYDNVIKYFNCKSKIEALAPFGTTRDFAEFERKLAKDAVDCLGLGVQIHDYETGAVTFQTDPLALVALADKLQQKSYKLLYLDYDFEAFKKVKLERVEYREYLKFLSDLKKYPEVQYYDDNVELE